jgi:hypothetical protein
MVLVGGVFGINYGSVGGFVGVLKRHGVLIHA